ENRRCRYDDARPAWTSDTRQAGPDRRLQPSARARERRAAPGGSHGAARNVVGWHRWSGGCAPAEGEKPIEDREQLGALPYVRELISTLIPAPAQRCLLARLPPAARIT